MYRGIETPLRFVFPVYPDVRARGVVSLTAGFGSDSAVRTVRVVSDQRFTSDLRRGVRGDWPSSAGFVRWNVKSKQVFVGAPPGE